MTSKFEQTDTAKQTEHYAHDNASQRLLADSGAWRGPSKSFTGKDRPVQPHSGEFPVLSPTDRGKTSQGVYKNELQVGHYMTPEAHKAALESLVHIRTPLSDGTIHDTAKGSGTVIGHGKDVTYVATVDHNTADHTEDPTALNGKKPILREGPI